MTPATLKAILNSAPLIVEGTARLIGMIRQREQEEAATPDLPATVEGLEARIQRLEHQIQAGSEADVEQIKLIEQLARQNETLAATQARALQRARLLTVLVIASLALAAAALIAAAV